MSERDELTEQVMDELQWLKRGDQSAADACKNIIALVRADERKRIREKLLSDEAADEARRAFHAWLNDDVEPHGPIPADSTQFGWTLQAALAAIGLTEEGGEE